MKNRVKIVPIVDSRVESYRYISDPGLSIFIEIGDHALLFDVDREWGIVEYNAKELGLDLSRVEAIVISHWHIDHCGGLEGAINYYYKELGKKIPIYVPTPIAYLEQEYNFVAVRKGLRIVEKVYSSGALGYITKEQSLIIDLDYGPLIIVGCNHPGLEQVILTALELLGKEKVYGVVGGLHIGLEDVYDVISLVKAYEMKLLAPFHCTPDEAIDIMANELGAILKRIRIGSVIVIE